MDKSKFDFLQGKECSVNINSATEFISASLYLGKCFTVLLNCCVPTLVCASQKNYFESLSDFRSSFILLKCACKYEVLPVLGFL